MDSRFLMYMYSCFLGQHQRMQVQHFFQQAHSSCNYQPLPSVLAANPWSEESFQSQSRGRHKAHHQRCQRHQPSPTLRLDCSKAQTKQPLGLLQCSNNAINWSGNRNFPTYTTKLPSQQLSCGVTAFLLTILFRNTLKH